MEIMKGSKRRETRRQRQPRAGHNGDHVGRQVKGDKATKGDKAVRPLKAAQNGDQAGRQGGRGSQEQARMEITQGDK